jgi:hypothetical protein
MKNLDLSSLTMGLRLKKQTKPKPRKKPTPEQAFRWKANRLKYKIFRGDLDISKQNDKRLFYWGLKHSVVTRDKQVRDESEWKQYI